MNDSKKDKPAEPPKDNDKGRQAQLDEAKDEGAGKESVPIDEVTTENDD